MKKTRFTEEQMVTSFGRRTRSRSQRSRNGTASAPRRFTRWRKHFGHQTLKEISRLPANQVVAAVHRSIRHTEATAALNDVRTMNDALAFTDGVPEAHNPEYEELARTACRSCSARPLTFPPTRSARGLPRR